MKKLYVSLIALMIVGLTTIAFAAPSGPDKPGPRGAQDKQMRFDGDHRGDFGSMGWGHFNRGDKLGSHLNLTQEQKGKIKDIRERFFADTHDLRYNIRIMKLEVEKLFTDPKADGTTIFAKDKELNSLVAKLMDTRAAMMMELRNVLTPEQIQKIGQGKRLHHMRSMRDHKEGMRPHQHG